MMMVSQEEDTWWLFKGASALSSVGVMAAPINHRHPSFIWTTIPSPSTPLKWSYFISQCYTLYRVYKLQVKLHAFLTSAPDESGQFPVSVVLFPEKGHPV